MSKAGSRPPFWAWTLAVRVRHFNTLERLACGFGSVKQERNRHPLAQGLPAQTKQNIASQPLAISRRNHTPAARKYSCVRAKPRWPRPAGRHAFLSQTGPYHSRVRAFAGARHAKVWTQIRAARLLGRPDSLPNLSGSTWFRSLLVLGDEAGWMNIHHIIIPARHLWRYGILEVVIKKRNVADIVDCDLFGFREKLHALGRIAAGN